jgi:hypothetical protein
MFIFLCRFAPGGLTLRSAGLKKGKKAPGEKLLALPRFPDNAECGKNLANLSNQFAVSPNTESSSTNTVSFSSAYTTSCSARWKE